MRGKQFLGSAIESSEVQFGGREFEGSRWLVWLEQDAALEGGQIQQEKAWSETGEGERVLGVKGVGIRR